MTDLTAYRALAERARADTSDGLEARELLADAVDELADEIDRLRLGGDTWYEWSATMLDRPVLARTRTASPWLSLPWPMPVWRRAVTTGPWTEVPDA